MGVVAGCGTSQVTPVTTRPIVPIRPTAPRFSSTLASGVPWRSVRPLNAITAKGPIAWAGGANVIYSTSSGGRRWKRLYQGRRRITQLDVLDRYTGWALGPAHLSEYTRGQWTPRSEPQGSHLTALTFLTANVGYGVAGSHLFRTVDTGRHWHIMHTPRGFIEAFTALSHGVLGLVIQGRLWTTHDSGRTWSRSESRLPIAPSRPWHFTLQYAAQAWWVSVTQITAHTKEQPYAVFRSSTAALPWQEIANNPTAAPSAYPIVRNSRRKLPPIQLAAFVVNGPANLAVLVGKGSQGTVLVAESPAVGTPHFTTTCLGGPNVPRTALHLAVTKQEQWLVGASRRHGRLLITTDLGSRWHPVAP